MKKLLFFTSLIILTFLASLPVQKLSAANQSIGKFYTAKSDTQIFNTWPLWMTLPGSQVYRELTCQLSFPDLGLKLLISYSYVTDAHSQDAYLLDAAVKVEGEYIRLVSSSGIGLLPGKRKYEYFNLEKITKGAEQKIQQEIDSLFKQEVKINWGDIKIVDKI